MKRVLVWGFGNNYHRYINCIKMAEQQGEFQVVGVAAKDGNYSSLDGYPFFKRDQLSQVIFDFVLVTAVKFFDEIADFLQKCGVTRKQIVPVTIFDIPGYTLDKYLHLLDNPVTIVSNNCWGGLLYHTLKLPFSSPFINMYVEDDDYLDLLENFNGKIKCPIHYLEDEFNEVEKFSYPVFDLDGVKLHMNHYRDVTDAKFKWNNRCKRIDFDNILFEMYTESEQNARRFAQLPFANKVCLFPSPLDEDCVISTDIYSGEYASHQFWEIANGSVDGKYPLFDVVELLLNKKIQMRVR